MRALPRYRVPHKFMKVLVLLSIVLLTGCAHEKLPVKAQTSPPQPVLAAVSTNSMGSTPVRAEQIRTDCVKGRRLICGRVLAIVPDGVVVDSGYTDLLRPPLTQSWVVPGTATAHRDPTVLELNEPGTPCIGLAFVTDIPKRPKVNNNDYVIIMGYPAGEHDYSPAPNVVKTIRKFAAGLETAVRLRLQEERTLTGGNSGNGEGKPK